MTRIEAKQWGLCPFHSEKTPSFAVKVKTSHTFAPYRNQAEHTGCRVCGQGYSAPVHTAPVKTVDFNTPGCASRGFSDGENGRQF